MRILIRFLLTQNAYAFQYVNGQNLIRTFRTFFRAHRIRNFRTFYLQIPNAAEHHNRKCCRLQRHPISEICSITQSSRDLLIYQAIGSRHFSFAVT